MRSCSFIVPEFKSLFSLNTAAISIYSISPCFSLVSAVSNLLKSLPTEIGNLSSLLRLDLRKLSEYVFPLCLSDNATIHN